MYYVSKKHSRILNFFFKMCNVLLLHRLSGNIHNSWDTCKHLKIHPRIQCPTNCVDRIFIPTESMRIINVH